MNSGKLLCVARNNQYQKSENGKQIPSPVGDFSSRSQQVLLCRRDVLGY